jgi:hypothetical protein
MKEEKQFRTKNQISNKQVMDGIIKIDIQGGTKVTNIGCNFLI